MVEYEPRSALDCREIEADHRGPLAVGPPFELEHALGLDHACLAGNGPSEPAREAPPAPAPAVAPEALLAAIEANLGKEPLSVDELVRRCDAPLAEVQAVLLELELEGRLDRHPGNRVTLRAG